MKNENLRNELMKKIQAGEEKVKSYAKHKGMNFLKPKEYRLYQQDYLELTSLKKQLQDLDKEDDSRPNVELKKAQDDYYNEAVNDLNSHFKKGCGLHDLMSLFGAHANIVMSSRDLNLEEKGLTVASIHLFFQGILQKL